MPLRVGIVGLVHGHVQGFLQQSLHSPEIEIVGIVEPDGKLASQYAKQYGFDRRLLFSDLEEMLKQTHPQAVLVYTNTYDHRRVVEICARHGVHVMMEKPLAVSFEDALAIEKAAHLARFKSSSITRRLGTPATAPHTISYTRKRWARSARLLFTTATVVPKKSASAPNS